MILIVSVFHLNYTKNMSKYLVQTKKRQSSTYLPLHLKMVL